MGKGRCAWLQVFTYQVFLLLLMNKLEEEVVDEPHIKLKGAILSKSLLTLETQNTLHILLLLND